MITPAIVRKKDGGRYELVSGHRRKFACIKLGLSTMRCEVVEISKDEAAMMLVESNFQRTEIFPTEKGYAYRLRLEAMRKIAGRPRLENCGTGYHNYLRERSIDILAKETGESRKTIQKFVRLTYLISELQKSVDERKLPIKAGAEISYINENGQQELFETIERTGHYPSVEEAKRLRREYEAREKAEKESVSPSDEAEPEAVVEEDSMDNPVAGSEPIRKDEPDMLTKSKNGRPHKQESNSNPIRTALSEYEDVQKAYSSDEPVTESKDEPLTGLEEAPDTVVESEIVISSETVRRYFNDFGSIENMEAFIRRSLDDNHERMKRQREQENSSVPAETEE